MKLEYSTISTKTKFTCDDIIKLKDKLRDSFIEKTRFESEDTGFTNIIKSKEEDITNFENQISFLPAEYNSF